MCSYRVPNRSGADPLPAERKAICTWLRSSVSNVCGTCDIASSGRFSVSVLGRNVSLVISFSVCSLPGATPLDVSRCRAREHSRRRICVCA